MLRELDIRHYERLLTNGEVPRGSLPSGLRGSALYDQLCSAGILTEQRKASGWAVRVLDLKALKVFLDFHAPDRASQTGGNTVSNVARYRDSKAGVRQAHAVAFLRGNGSLQIAGQAVDLKQQSDQFGIVAVAERPIEATRLCLIENLDVFFEFEKLIGPDWIALHPYGRVSNKLSVLLSAKELVHFPDYDFTGLDEFLRIRETHPHVQLFVPQNYDQLHRRYARLLKEGAVPSHRLKHCQLPEVQHIFESVGRSQRFLEQQALLAHLESLTEPDV